MFHRHKWTLWEFYTQDMLHVSKYGTHKYIREYQQRKCTTCGLTRVKEM